ncbi:ATP-binding cassette domain-containing protein [Embleya hyalina]|uniref:Dipeptide/oligopeptide/nickel ABC transporter ATP-binding protein n=1 Tax=Embleya hyalina TaxID=516124 RepID=A0A401Z0B9_9ACTN|nr:ATP-binding cassette domain-containing protein [Embleya hyalina]GCE00272.1 dipeptide/oligopeptide/nickel ABC transporter ATP-binding protein [Embleya hyalina]
MKAAGTVTPVAAEAGAAPVGAGTSGSLELRHITVRYGRGRSAVTAVDDVSLEVPAGRVVGLVGGSGSGKSTLGRAAVGLVPITAGNVLVDGVDQGRRPGRRPVQLVFQDPFASLNPRLSVGASVAEAVPREDRARRAEEVARYLDLVGIDPGMSTRLPHALSGGQRQRVALARALAARPAVLVADEVTSALDVSVQGAVLNLIRDLQRELGFAMLFITHNLAVVRYLADRIAVMDRGVLVEEGPAGQVLEDPEHEYTRALLSGVPRIGEPLPESAGAEGAKTAGAAGAASGTDEGTETGNR